MKLHEYLMQQGCKSMNGVDMFYRLSGAATYSCIQCGELLQGDKLQNGCPNCGYRGPEMPSIRYHLGDHFK